MTCTVKRTKWSWVPLLALRAETAECYFCLDTANQVRGNQGRIGGGTQLQWHSSPAIWRHNSADTNVTRWTYYILLCFWCLEGFVTVSSYGLSQMLMYFLSSAAQALLWKLIQLHYRISRWIIHALHAFCTRRLRRNPSNSISGPFNPREQ